ncbi:protein-tyrosine phosphatase-like protein [Amylocystis lapponica]|nr:protein-tyrosine phosphatase-like protein [Amylocystis lapponica]
MSPQSSPTQLRSAPPTEIIPRLYISDLTAAECPKTLATLGITHVVSAMPGTVMLPPGLAIQRLQLPVHDSPFAELAELLPSATAFMADALCHPNSRVLVHCMQGVSRSSSVVCAFLIAQYGWTPERALQYLKERWRQADPNPGFVSQLREYALSLRGAPRQ